MDERRPHIPLQALGAGSSRALRLPGREPFPRLDDHLVEPEVTRDEIIAGRRVVASPAKWPHATQHSRLDYVLDAHVAKGYVTATDLITRFSTDSDFATDACVSKEGTDPATGERYLEEVAFEVVSTQNEGYVTTKAQRMQQRCRGSRRVDPEDPGGARDHGEPGGAAGDRALQRSRPVGSLAASGHPGDLCRRGHGRALMPHPRYSSFEIAERGQELYDRVIL